MSKERMLNGTLKPYLVRSAAGHALLTLPLAWFLTRANSVRPAEVYRIDFIGATPGILNREREAGAAAPKADSAPPAAKPPPQTDPDALASRRPRRPLPRPSFLAPTLRPPEPAKPAPSAPQQAASLQAQASEGKGGEGSGQGSAQVAADMPDFPYPWYLSQLRGALWDRWAQRMPAQAGECTVVFSVMRDGRTVDLRVESTSGDSAFDYQALSAVQAAAPFPPLPPGFRDPFLKIHVQFKTH